MKKIVTFVLSLAVFAACSVPAFAIDFAGEDESDVQWRTDTTAGSEELFFGFKNPVLISCPDKPDESERSFLSDNKGLLMIDHNINRGTGSSLYLAYDKAEIADGAITDMVLVDSPTELSGRQTVTIDGAEYTSVGCREISKLSDGGYAVSEDSGCHSVTPGKYVYLFVTTDTSVGNSITALRCETSKKLHSYTGWNSIAPEQTGENAVVNNGNLTPDSICNQIFFRSDGIVFNEVIKNGESVSDSESEWSLGTVALIAVVVGSLAVVGSAAYAIISAVKKKK